MISKVIGGRWVAQSCWSSRVLVPKFAISPFWFFPSPRPMSSASTTRTLQQFAGALRGRCIWPEDNDIVLLLFFVCKGRCGNSRSTISASSLPGAKLMQVCGLPPLRVFSIVRRRCHNPCVGLLLFFLDNLQLFTCFFYRFPTPLNLIVEVKFTRTPRQLSQSPPQTHNPLCPQKHRPQKMSTIGKRRWAIVAQMEVFLCLCYFF